ncbi:hypothetical protein AN8612.2 [Aspergillus nidulans FGSC A4]|uniref:Uncharacterized protein n=1 Tax=Emericella nidulans (strain FGSC A4 / ATCC 38163 / CBS 112.46 / NRRL 194 / M139) TaxID=227321 RepID=Q5ASW8_EMENI|nr:hypothetical protein [Aspergillus nidulans FGSC A4]EAA60646.1 hypothetical protein AN8612.2 [Aspergillus nidulans FGSC A4]CBF78329.1 TPA: hypothetical protein ANIA_08612 [Aspergillus nidulans FGSC A4]|eukprot:XP_681881.1 hypothetical protein AN8612.2 [Aspergillus nidulans FGSC A4]
MPSGTSTLGWSLANWGTLPATWTSSSCTPSSIIYYAEDDDPDIPELFESCPSTTFDSCLPEPTDSDLIDDFLSNQRNVPYWSPGVNCPSGWEAVGSAARPSDGDVTSSGIFTVGAIPTGNWDIPDNDYIQLGFHDAFGALLDPSETAVACCPSSMTAGRNGICYSTLPDRDIRTVCIADFSNADGNLEFISTSWVWNGVTRTANIAVPTLTIPRTPTRTSSRTIDADETGDMVAATMQVPIYFVRRPGDGGGNGNGNGDGNSSDLDNNGSNGSGTSDADTVNETNAARGLHMQKGYTKDWGHLGGMLGVLAASLLAGAVLVLPW